MGPRNDCDLGPAEFQLETQSIVRRVLMTYINGFLVAGGQCLGTWFVKCQTSLQPLCFGFRYSHQSPGGATPTSWHATVWPPPHVLTSGWYNGPSQCSPLFSLSFHLFLPRQESLSHLCVAELWVRTQHRAHRSLISVTSDHSSRSSRQNYLKSCIWKKVHSVFFSFFLHKKVDKASITKPNLI